MLLLLAFSTVAGPDDDITKSDIAHRQSMDFKLKSKKRSYELSCIVKVSKTFQTERSTLDRDSYIPGFYFAKVDKVKARFQGENLKGGSIYSYVPQDEDEFFNEAEAHVIRVPYYVQPGDTLEYEYRIKYDEVALLPYIRIPNLDFVEHFEISFNHPKDVRVDFECFFPRDEITHQVLRPDQRKTILVFDSIPYVKPLDAFPFDHIQASVLPRLTKQEEPINPFTIRDFVDWYGGLVDLEPALGEELDTLLADTLSAVTDDLEKLRIIYHYVRDGYRYVADARRSHTITPFSLSQIVENKYGDCKDRAYLVSALAAREGLKVHLALVTALPGRWFDGVNFIRFNHVICSYQDGSEILLIDPTVKYVPFGSLSGALVGLETLILDPDNPRFVTVTDKREQASVEVAIRGSMDSLQTGSATITLRHDQFVRASEAHCELTGADLENYLDRLITTHFYKIALDKYQVTRSEGSEMVLAAEADLSDFVVFSPSRKYLPSVPFVVVSPDVLDRADDSLPIYTGAVTQLTLDIDLEVNGLSFRPESVTIGSADVAQFRGAMHRIDSSLIHLSYNYCRARSLMQGEAKRAYLQFCREYLENKKNLFILEVDP